MNRASFRSARALVFAVAASLAEPAAAADQVVANCSNDVELRADLTAMQASGGTLTFSCSPSAIALTAVLPLITQSVTIDGGGKITLSGANSSRIFMVDASGTLELENIVLTNASSGGDGGAIFNSGSLTLRSVEVKNSASVLSGGGIVTYGPLTIENSTLSGNRATNAGAVYARFSAAVVSIHDSVLHDNETIDKQTGLGGAVLLWDGASVTIDGSHLHDNQAGQGGAVNNPFANSSVTIRNSVLERNVVGVQGFIGTSHGGAVYSVGGPLTIEATAIVDSNARADGGGVYASGGTVSIEDSLFRGNFGRTGAGIYCNNACQLTMRRSTFYDNQGRAGGGAGIGGAVATFENVTFGGNDAFESGGSLYVLSAQVTLSNCTLHQNGAGSGDIFAGVGTAKVFLRNTIVSGSFSSNCFGGPDDFVSLDGNLSDDNTCTTGLTGLNDLNGSQYDPLLVLSSTEGPSQFLYVPQPGSPALDGGVSSGAPSVDQRGVPRPQGIANDKGSVEVAACGNVVCGDASGDGNVVAADALLALRTAVGSGTCPLWRCDFNGDESVTSSDALSILRTAVGHTLSPNCPDAWDCID